MSKLASFALACLLLGCATPRRTAIVVPSPAFDLRPVSSFRETVAIVERSRDSESAIQAFEDRRFDFPLDAPHVEALRDSGASPEVILYLEQRANAEWRERIVEYDAERANVWFTDAPDPTFFRDFAGPGASRGTILWGPPSVDGAAALRHALAKPPGREPFPDARLEKPSPTTD